MANSSKNDQATFDAALFGLTLDRVVKGAARVPLHMQLAEALRVLILSGGGTAGLRLPSGRSLAAELSVSRMTVTTAYEQLLGEGYLETRRGSGTFVANRLPHQAPVAHPEGQTAHPSAVKQPSSTSAPPARPWLPFHFGLPDPALFPHRIWARHLERVWRAPEPALLAQPDRFGWHPLRAAICAHLAVWRGLVCDPQQVVITSGAAEAIDIICAAILPADRAVAVEDPCWQPLRGRLEQAGLRVRALPVDADGLDASALAGHEGAAFVTPSRHYPTGAVMPLARRLALLDWAARHGSLVIEDDYDSEFRYRGQPLPSLAGLDAMANTLYLGSFSKVLNPALRIGYLVLPERFIAPVRAHFSDRSAGASLVPQPALATFMAGGDFAVHLRRMRRTYAKRQACLIAALQETSDDAPNRQAGRVTDWLDVRPDPSGMHLCCPVRPVRPPHAARPSNKAPFTDRQIAQACRARGLVVGAVSEHSVLPDPPQGLLLGYAAFEEQALQQAARRLATVLHELPR